MAQKKKLFVKYTNTWTTTCNYQEKLNEPNRMHAPKILRDETRICRILFFLQFLQCQKYEPSKLSLFSDRILQFNLILIRAFIAIIYELRRIPHSDMNESIGSIFVLCAKKCRRLICAKTEAANTNEWQWGIRGIAIFSFEQLNFGHTCWTQWRQLAKRATIENSCGGVMVWLF